MTKYSKDTTATKNSSRNIDKWIALGLMQRFDQVYNIAGLLSATMEDLSDQMTELESELENMSDATETIQEKIDEMMDLIQEEIGQVPNDSEMTSYLADGELPF